MVYTIVAAIALPLYLYQTIALLFLAPLKDMLSNVIMLLCHLKRNMNLNTVFFQTEFHSIFENQLLTL